MHQSLRRLCSVNQMEVPIKAIKKGTKWATTKQIRDFLDEMSRSMNFTSMDEWYNVKKADIIARGGGRLLTKFSSSVRDILHDAYPEHTWRQWLFPQTKNNTQWWAGVDNQRLYVEWLGNKLGITSDLSKWYDVQAEVFVKNNGVGLMTHFGYSVPSAMQAIYPDHVWRSWLFYQAPRGSWDDLKTQRQYVEWLSEKLGLRSLPGDLYFLTRSDFTENSGAGLLRIYGNSVFQLLQTIYPEHKWYRQTRVARLRTRRNKKEPE